jgi:hypothetical protein
VEGIIVGQTGIRPQRLERDDFGDDKAIINKLDELLARKDVSNLYLNFSINTGSDGVIYGKLLALAKRGANIYIAAGNDGANSLAKAGPAHPNIHIVGASNGLVGSAQNSTQLATYKTPTLTDVVNGVVKPVVTSRGVDLTGDGKPDLAQDEVGPLPNDASNLELRQVDATRAIEKLGRIPYDTDNLPANAVVSVRSLRQKGLLPDFYLTDLQKSSGKTLAELDNLYLHVGRFRDYDNSLGGSGGLVLYQAASNTGRLSLVKQSTLDQAASSWATPNLLSRDVNRARSGGH